MRGDTRSAIGAGLSGGIGRFMQAFQMLSDMKRQKEQDKARQDERAGERAYRDSRDAQEDTQFTLNAKTQGFTRYVAPTPQVGGGLSADISALRDLGTDEVVNTPRGAFRYQKPEDPVLAREKSKGEMATAGLESLARDFAAAQSGDKGAYARVVTQSPELARVLSPEPKSPTRGTPEYLKMLDDEKTVTDRHEAPRVGASGSFGFYQDAGGNPIAWNPTTGEVREGPQGASRGAGAGGVDMRKRDQAIKNTRDALDRFERTFDEVGTQLMPGPKKSALQTEYRTLLLQMKELNNLGVLNGPDLMLMEQILTNPTGLNQIQAGLTGDARKASIKEQVRRVRQQLESTAANLQTKPGEPSASPSPFGDLVPPKKQED